MKKKIIALALVMATCLPIGTAYNNTETVSALTVIADIKDVSVDKTEISVGESTQLSVEWEYGIKSYAHIYSSDTSVLKVENISDDFTSCTITAVGEGTAEIIAANDYFSKAVEITVAEELTPMPTEETVLAEPACWIEIVSKPKTEYTIGEKLDLSGLLVDVKFARGGEIPISQLNKYETVRDDVNPLDEPETFIVDTSAFNSNKAGSYEITIGLSNEKASIWWYCPETKITLTVKENSSLDYILPKTMDEYKAFLEKYGNVSVHGKYIVYCDEVNYSTGVEVILEQLGTAEIKETEHYSIETDEPLPAGTPSNDVFIYEAVTPGTIKVTISQGRPWNLEESKQIKKIGYYEISDDLNIEEIEENDFIEPVKGDVNADGVLNIVDIVLLQKWLLAVPDTELPNWKAADLCKDSKLNVFDLCMMKRTLISQTIEMD